MTTAGLRLSYSSSLFGSRRSLGFQRSSETVIAGSAQVVHHKARGVSFSRNLKTIFKDGMNDTIKESLHKKPQSHGNEGSQGVPVFVMLPLDTVSINGSLNRKRALNASLMALRSAGVKGVMVDIWWGLVENDAPNIYNWSGYRDLINMVASHGLSLQAVMSFHQCGGNVGDNCFIPLPRWVLEEVEKSPNIVYTDRAGRRNNEYVSLGCDLLPVLKGRSPIQAYEDFMVSFRNEFQEYLGNIIVEIQVGMGPCGELRYPSYPESQGLWHYPGIGEFQCYDEYMRASLLAAAEAVGRPEWGKDGPGNSGSYKQFPEDTGFFKNEGSWKTDYGHFFMKWYSDMLLQHGERILASASAVFKGTGAVLSGKVAGIHWHYGTRSHAAELTAGYYNTRHHDGYKAVARVMGRHGAALNFTCFEMRDEEQASANARCSPEGLLRQVASAAGSHGVPLAGENALQRYDDTAFRQILRNATVPSASLCAFTFLRMNRQLYESDNWRRFVWFMKNMSEGSDRLQRQEEERHRQHGDTVLSVSSALRTQAADALLLT